MRKFRGEIYLRLPVSFINPYALPKHTQWRHQVDRPRRKIAGVIGDHSAHGQMHLFVWICSLLLFRAGKEWVQYDWGLLEKWKGFKKNTHTGSDLHKQWICLCLTHAITAEMVFTEEATPPVPHWALSVHVIVRELGMHREKKSTSGVMRAFIRA